MSTIIKLVPKAHATKRTTVVQATNDGVIRTRVENPVGTDTDKSFNFSTLAEGDPSPAANEPVVRVDTQKIGTVASYVIEVTNFYDESLTGDAVPTEYFIWYDYKTKADEAPDSETPQTFPVTMLWTTAGTPQAPTRALSPTAQTIGRLYQNLGSLEARREHLKGNILSYINNPDWGLWMAGSLSAPATNVNNFLVVSRRQSFVFWLEMLTRAISIDGNLDTERKFNLLNGESTLDVKDVLPRIEGFVNDVGANVEYDYSRTNWNYRRLGSIPAVSPYNYNPPTYTLQNGNPVRVQAQVDSLITLSNDTVGDSWTDWLRS